MVDLRVTFDRATYSPGDTVTITVTDEQYAGLPEIGNPPVKALVLTDSAGVELASWTVIPAVPGQPHMFRVAYVLPATVRIGTITAVYTDPL
ncbi:TPA: hypothetical protein DCY67_04760, partial [Candidatus Acetothermia bacterium]|nr:hypothetical protein [Candidatus Acetothermia bacterium]